MDAVWRGARVMGVWAWQAPGVVSRRLYTTSRALTILLPQRGVSPIRLRTGFQGRITTGSTSGPRSKKKPLDEKTPADYGVDMSSKQQIIKVEPPAERKAGITVKSVDELVDKLRNEAKVI